jgi:hypothetical protein
MRDFRRSVEVGKGMWNYSRVGPSTTIRLSPHCVLVLITQPQHNVNAHGWCPASPGALQDVDVRIQRVGSG